MKKKAIIGLSCLVLSTIGVAACGASTGTDVSNQETTTTQEMTTESTVNSTTTTYETTVSTEAMTTTIMDNNTSSGIIILNVENNTATLDILNPETGEWSAFKTFKPKDSGVWISSILGRGNFSKDFTKLAAHGMNDQVGWIDEEGNFINVTDKVSTSTGDFGAAIKHAGGYFDAEDYFYFTDKTNGETQSKRVPITNVSPSSLEPYDITTGEPQYEVDGTVEKYSKEKNIVYNYFDSNMEYPFYYTGELTTDWISKNEIVGVEAGDVSYSHPDYNLLYKYTLSGEEKDRSSTVWYEDKELLVPKIEGRINSHPIVSPDGKTVAFFSKLTTGDDNNIYLFTVPSEGGDPVKVKTDYIIDSLQSTLDWK